jgi:hypothetical protein
MEPVLNSQSIMRNFKIDNKIDNNDTLEVINYFLEKVYYHYPVGFTHFYNTYRGYLVMEEIVMNKINLECNDPTSLSNVLVNKIRNDFPDLRVENKNFFNFPSYVITLELSSVLNGAIKHITALEICISLICDYYTMYFIEDFKFEALYKQGNSVRQKTSCSIYSFESSKIMIDNRIVTGTISSINYYFGQKKFVSHDFLNRYFINEVYPFPMNLDISLQQKKSSFFELLFHQIFNKENSIFLP